MRAPCVCVVCGVQFTPKDARWTTCCSRVCGFQLRRNRIAARRAFTPPKEKMRKVEQFCLHCGVSVGEQYVPQYCSSTCNWAAYKVRHPDALERVSGTLRRRYAASPEIRSKANMRAHKRRTLVLGQFVEPIDPAEIYERDAGVCGLCKGTVDRTLRHPHPQSASLDHIVPVSRGGLHERTNVHLAHFRCNISKGNRVEARSNGLTQSVSTQGHT